MGVINASGVSAGQFINPMKPLDFSTNTKKGSQNENIFQNVFQSTINNVKETNRDYVNQQYLISTGQMDDPQQLMTAATKAEMSVELLVQLRNKAVDAYDQLIKTNV